MLLLLVTFAAADTLAETPGDVSTETADIPSTATTGAVARIPSGRTYCGEVSLVAGLVGVDRHHDPLPFAGADGALGAVAARSGALVDRYGNVRALRGAAPVLYVDGLRVMTTAR